MHPISEEIESMMRQPETKETRVSRCSISRECSVPWFDWVQSIRGPSQSARESETSEAHTREPQPARETALSLGFVERLVKKQAIHSGA